MVTLWWAFYMIKNLPGRFPSFKMVAFTQTKYFIFLSAKEWSISLGVMYFDDLRLIFNIIKKLNWDFSYTSWNPFGSILDFTLIS